MTKVNYIFGLNHGKTENIFADYLFNTYIYHIIIEKNLEELNFNQTIIEYHNLGKGEQHVLPHKFRDGIGYKLNNKSFANALNENEDTFELKTFVSGEFQIAFTSFLDSNEGEVNFDYELFANSKHKDIIISELKNKHQVHLLFFDSKVHFFEDSIEAALPGLVEILLEKKKKIIAMRNWCSKYILSLNSSQELRNLFKNFDSIIEMFDFIDEIIEINITNYE